jgi:hypothetical protein
MPRGDKSSYADTQKRMAHDIGKGDAGRSNAQTS